MVLPATRYAPRLALLPAAGGETAASPLPSTSARNLRVSRCCRRDRLHRQIAGYADPRPLAAVGVDVVLQPAREDHERPGTRREVERRAEQAQLGDAAPAAPGVEERDPPRR